ncbi:hypothetical protein [Legionella sp. km772]|uniref:hypothetical protein n=1 Tax=Legionella sp. km772 TaxID=2498111 RepID=UPI000F8F6AE8|nr:hypothetical protein [Legionella sp. km772]RUR06182.1 hypothetical protein ELY15_13465 [Legionella sp. km772]
MKLLTKIGLLSPLFLSTSLFALKPIDGFYGGLLGEISHGPSGDEIYFHEGGMLFHGNVEYSPVSGGAGFMLGYKYKHLRGEGEFLFNRISTGPLTVGTCTIESPDVVTPTGLCPPGIYDGFKAKALGYSGNSTAIYGLFNVIWDFYSEEEHSDVAPYLGIGAGMASIKNGSSFINTNTDYSHGQTHNSSGIAYQGIVGISYFMDDFTWCSMDYRFLTTNRKPDTTTDVGSLLPSKTYLLNTFNLTINAAFDKGAIS